MKPLIEPPKPADFMKASDGSIDFGLIDVLSATALKVVAAPIRLQIGRPGANGWGAKHILTNEKRMAHIKEIGFRGVAHFVETVGRNFNRISDGGDGRLALVQDFQRLGEQSLDLELIVLAKLHEEENIWSVTTAIPKRVSRSKVLYQKPANDEEGENDRTERSEPSQSDVSNRSRRETLSLPKILTRDGKGS